MYYDNNILKKPQLIEIKNNVEYHYNIEYVNDTSLNKQMIFIKDKNKRRSCLVLINMARKNNHMPIKTKKRIKKYGFIIDSSYNIILDTFKKELIGSKNIVKKYQSKPEIKNKIKLYHRLYYYKKNNKTIPEKYIHQKKLFSKAIF